MLVVVALTLLLCGSPAYADSWALPEKASFLSADNQTRLTIIPRKLESQLAYFEDKVKAKEPAGARAQDRNSAAIGILEKRGPHGRWTELWRRQLSNEVAPVSALVSNAGRHVVTFDNWHSVGYGDNVVVIYGAKGNLVRSFGLKNFLSERRIDELPHSVSSIHWGREHRFSGDGSKLILRVLAPSQDAHDPKAKYEDVEIDLATGKVLEPSDRKVSVGIATGIFLLGAGAIALKMRRR